jgi:hypothetical protein
MYTACNNNVGQLRLHHSELFELDNSLIQKSKHYAHLATTSVASVGLLDTNLAVLTMPFFALASSLESMT